MERGLVCCIDPGLRCCGVAVFAPYGRLLRAGLPKSKFASDSGIRGPAAWRAMADAVLAWYSKPIDPDPDAIMQPPSRVVLEEQRIDVNRTRNPDDILQVSGVAGACSRIFATNQITSYVPEHWKGSIDADAMTARIRSRLQENPAELSKLEKVAASLEHNMLDAVGIGLHHFGRLAARKAISR